MHYPNLLELLMFETNQLNYFILAFYTFVFLTVVALWDPKKKQIQSWQLLLGITTILGILTRQITFIALVPIILLPLAVWLSEKPTVHIAARIIATLLVFIIGLGLILHLLPGFNNYKALNQIYLSSDAISFSMYLNFDKALVGISILGFGHKLILNQKEFIKLLKQLVLPMTATVIGVICLALIVHFVHFDPKFPNTFFIWAVTNLLLVSVPEEAFFRGFIQRKLSLLFNESRVGNYVSVLIAAIAFGLLHYPGGFEYILLATMAGIGYGAVYVHTGRIEAAIFTHFTVNLIHFFLFTYPMLAVAAQ